MITRADDIANDATLRWFEEDPSRVKGPEQRARLRFIGSRSSRLHGRVKALLAQAGGGDA